ncbi:hypothetical protein [Agreia pratensis]|uniref:Uncharacterized protein n=1 Tax=Agreia pratensis TaxID=150121 RepID=A0A1X7JKT2_9MICO|nr:hypothetical protein [Agreia pratensis]SMG28620.1 hypothetical protein SAMN06296010_1475 [Agreia pratensis]
MTDEQPRPRRGYYARLSEEDAAARGLTLEEYGVYKGRKGSLVLPVNSAGGLLALSIILTAAAVGVGVLLAIIAAQDAGLLPAPEKSTPWEPYMWVTYIGFLAFPIFSWVYYAKERRAQKLRIARGLPRTLRNRDTVVPQRGHS